MRKQVSNYCLANEFGLLNIGIVFVTTLILTHCRVENCTDFIELRWNIYGWEVGNIFGYNRGTSIFGVIQTIRSNWLRLDWKSQISQKWKIFPLYLLHLIRLCNPQDSQEYFPVKQKYLTLYTWALHFIKSGVLCYSISMFLPLN